MLNIKPLEADCIPEVVLAFSKIGWHKPVTLFQQYLEEQTLNQRNVWIAFDDSHVQGYITLKWLSSYQPFKEQLIPEINDFNVLPHYQNQGIGTQLMNLAENQAKIQSKIVGLGVGLSSDYGDAQRLYVKRGYIPDGRGITYRNRFVEWESKVILDDDLILWMVKKLEK